MRMKTISEELRRVVRRRMQLESVSQTEQRDYLKWVRYYLHETHVQRAIGGAGVRE